LDELRASFENPGREYRGASFWAWNGRLAREELLRQVEDMKEHGLGGFFMHSRVGLETPYMEEEFLDLVEAVVKKAEETGMKAYLYDEDRWPSGFAGGKVPAAGEGDAFRNKFLAVQRKDEWDGKGNVLAVYSLSFGKGGRVLIGEGEPYVFVEKVCPPTPWFNGDTYADNMNPECVRKFIEVTYERYRTRVGRWFGTVIPGIFTDEPNVLSDRGTIPPGMRVLPWTSDFPRRFHRMHGYSLVENLPYLFFDGPKSSEVRYHYWETVTRLFVEAYTRQIGEWCDRHGIALTGHMLAEQDIPSQVRKCGAVMPHYELMQYPGIDILCERITENLTVKQCASVARQFGRGRMLSELYGCTGWDFSFEGQKWVGDWQMALGVNLRCQHLTWYTMKGSAKRDYPPCFNYQHPMWEHYPIVEDYFARLSWVLSRGEPVRDVLVIHPVGSGWALMSDETPEEVWEVDRQLNRTVDILLGAHVDFDFGDETIISQHGRVTEEGKFAVNRALYEVVIVPYAYTLARSTFRLLREFAAAGGRIIALRRLPTMVEGKESEELASFWKADGVTVCNNHREEILHALRNVYDPPVSLTTGDGRDIEPVIYQLRKAEEARFLFLANRDRKAGYSGFLRVKAPGGVEEWDCKTGRCRPVGAFRHGERLTIPVEIPASGSRVFVFSERFPLHEPAGRVEAVPRRVVPLEDTWEFARKHPNALPLDFCRYRVNGGEFSERMMVLRAQDEILETLGLKRDIRSRWVYLKSPKDVEAEVELELSFEVVDLPAAAYLTLEEYAEADVRVNGEKAPPFDGWYLDRAIGRTEVTALLKRGTNIVTLRWRFRDGMQLEEVYLAGDFAVDGRRRVVKEPERLAAGDYCTQGYPFYSGSMVYAQDVVLEGADGTRYVLHVPGYRGVTALVRVNGRDAGDISWPPFRCDITRLVRNTSNRVEIEVVGSPRNLLGPNHFVEKYPVWTGPGQFVYAGPSFTEEYTTVPHGLNPGVSVFVEDA